MNHTLLAERMSKVAALFEAHPNLPHPVNVEVSTSVYGTEHDDGNVAWHLSALGDYGDYKGRTVAAIDAIVGEFGTDDWALTSIAASKYIDGIEVTVYLPPRDAEEGLAKKLLSLGWTPATEAAF